MRPAHVAGDNICPCGFRLRCGHDLSASLKNARFSDVLKTWLRKVSAEEDLITLVQKALEDSRLLLFVDGLDEWSDETAARTALTLLEQFVGERNVPAITSSRPLGYERIGGLSSRWSKVKLAGLTQEQQRILVEQWCPASVKCFCLSRRRC